MVHITGILFYQNCSVAAAGKVWSEPGWCGTVGSEWGIQCCCVGISQVSEYWPKQNKRPWWGCELGAPHWVSHFQQVELEWTFPITFPSSQPRLPTIPLITTESQLRVTHTFIVSPCIFCSLSFSPTYALIYIVRILSQAVSLNCTFHSYMFQSVRIIIREYCWSLLSYWLKL